MSNPIGSPVIQKTTEAIAYTFDWSADGTPTIAAVTVIDRNTGGSITLIGSPAIVGQTIVTQNIAGLIEGHTYNMTCAATISGVVLVSVCIIICTDGIIADYETDITLNDMIMEVARQMGTVYDGITTAGGTTLSLIDTINLTQPDDYFNKGSVFILSGSEKGAVKTVDNFVNSTGALSWVSATSIGIGVDVDYAVITPEYPYTKIKAAINAVLKHEPFLQKNETITTVADTVEYSLPVNVNNIKRVEIARGTTTPYYYVIYQNWKEINGKLVFDNAYFPSAGYKIRVWYSCPHGELLAAGVLRSAIDPEWLKWAATAWLYRDQITRIQKDNPTAVDLLNEAKQKEDECRKHMKRYSIGNMDRDPKLATW